MPPVPPEATASQVVSKELRDLLQTPDGQASRVGAWAIDFAQATHNLDDGATAADLAPSITQGATYLQILAQAIADGRLHAGEGYQGQKAIQRLDSAYIGSENTAAQLTALGIPAEAQAALGIAANATAQFSTDLDRGIYGNLPLYNQPYTFDQFALDFGGMVAAVGLPQTQTGRFLWNGILRDGLNPTPNSRIVKDPHFQPAPPENEQPAIRTDAQFIANIAGALYHLETRIGKLWPDQTNLVDVIKGKFLKSIGIHPESISLLEDPKALAVFKSQLIQTGFLDQLSKGQPEATTTGATALPEQVQPASPDRVLMTEIASVTKALAEKGTGVDASIKELQTQLTLAEKQRAGITEAQERLGLHHDRLEKASGHAQETAKLRSLVGEEPETAQVGVEVLQLQLGSEYALLHNSIDPSLMGILLDPKVFAQTLAELYDVPADKQAELAQATGRVASIMKAAEILPGDDKFSLAPPLKSALANARSVIGEPTVTQKAAEIDNLLNPDASLIVTDADRQTIQQDVQSARSLV